MTDAIMVAEGHLHPRPPFEFRHSLAFLRRFPAPAGELRPGDVSLRRGLLVDGRSLAAELTSRGKVESPLLRYRLFAAPEAAAKVDVDAVAERLGFFLSIDDDVQALYDRGWDDDPFADVLDRLYGYHQVKFITPFAAAVWAILSQRTALAQARARQERLVAAYGGTMELEGQVYAGFPEPAGLLAPSPDALQKTIGHARQADYLREAAHAFHDADKTFLRHGPYNEVRAWLTGIKGIGPWSALLILLRGLGRVETFDVTAERRFLTAARQVYGAETTLDRLRDRAAHYGPVQGYWAHYIRVAEMEENREIG